MQGKFCVKSCDKIDLTIKYCLHDDSTLMSPYDIGDYELLLSNGYHIAMGVDKKSGQCLSIVCLLDALDFEKKAIDFLDNTYKQYDLIYVSNDLQYGSGDHYAPFERKCYYDAINSILAFGNIYEEGETILFNGNTFAKIKDQQLLAVFIKVSDDVIYYIERKNRKKKKNIFES